MLASAARRADATPGDPDRLIQAIASVTAETLTSPQRLRMVDYDAVARQRPQQLPSLAQILATFGSWKHARALTAAACRPH